MNFNEISACVFRDENGRENPLTIPATIFFGRERENEIDIMGYWERNISIGNMTGNRELRTEHRNIWPLQTFPQQQ